MQFNTFLAVFAGVCVSAGAVMAGDAPLWAGPVVGAVTSTSADFVLVLGETGVAVRVTLLTGEGAVSQEAVSPAYVPGAVRLRFDGLAPATGYHYSVALDGKTLPGAAGRFRTFPVEGLAASFTFAFGNCKAHDRPEISGLIGAAQCDPLFFLDAGDLFYADIATNDAAVFRAAYTKSLGGLTPAPLLSKTPLVYIWDDHDYGPNDGDRTAPGRAASRQVYQEMIPHYPLVAGHGDVPIYQAFSVGRVRFILTDLRSERAPPTEPEETRSMMGVAQLDWFKRELAGSAATHGLVVWVSSVPWTGQPGAPSSDSWMSYTNERQVVADWVKTNGIDNLLIIAGDAHSAAADDGSHGDYATGGGAPIPTFIAAPLDNEKKSYKGGPYSHGMYLPGVGEGMYGLATVTDNGGPITIHLSARNQRQEEKVHMDFTTP